MAAPAKQMTNGGHFRSRGERIVNPVWDREGGIQTRLAVRSPRKLTETNSGSWEFLQLNVDSVVSIAYKLNGTTINGSTCPVSGYWVGANLKSQNF